MIRLTLPSARPPLFTLVLLTSVVLLSACGSEPVQAPGKPWHHLSNGEYRNPQGSAGSAATFGDMIGFFSGKTVLTDPYLTARAGRLGLGPLRFVEPGLSLASLPPIDIIVVSHNHYDHLDENTIEALPDKQRTHVVVPLGLGEFFSKRGYANVHERDWFESVSLDGVEVEVLPAIHFSRRGAFDKNRTLWGGFAIRANGKAIFHSGDTAYGPIFSEIGERAGPFDVALVAIGAYLPASIMETVHITPEEAVRVVDDVMATSAVGMHWGTVRLTDEDPFEPPQRFFDAASRAQWAPNRAWIMKIGETLPLSDLIARKN
jgi:N-acyl-phosphatidylethanolamine-hydrolysing phospholipase D